MVVIDDKANKLFEKRLPNTIEAVSIKPSLTNVIVESMYNWFGLVDGLEKSLFT